MDREDSRAKAEKADTSGLSPFSSFLLNRLAFFGRDETASCLFIVLRFEPRFGFWCADGELIVQRIRSQVRLWIIPVARVDLQFSLLLQGKNKLGY